MHKIIALFINLTIFVFGAFSLDLIPEDFKQSDKIDSKTALNGSNLVLQFNTDKIYLIKNVPLAKMNPLFIQTEKLTANSGKSYGDVFDIIYIISGNKLYYKVTGDDIDSIAATQETGEPELKVTYNFTSTKSTTKGFKLYLQYANQYILTDNSNTESSGYAGGSTSTNRFVNGYKITLTVSDHPDLPQTIVTITPAGYQNEKLLGSEKRYLHDLHYLYFYRNEKSDDFPNFIAEKDVRLRSAPSLDGKIITQLSNQKIRILSLEPVISKVDNESGYWINVKDERGNTGYVWGKFIKGYSLN
jgi:hypothetical protein